MNERIRELAVEAGLIAPHGSDREGLRDFDYRMFAELIVRECVGIADEYDGVGSTIVSRIEKHFGVDV